VRFSNRHSQRVLKSATQPMDNARGQFILEALTWQGGTYPASACAFISSEVFKCVRGAGHMGHGQACLTRGFPCIAGRS
jgi:hypothetical protein